MNSYELNNKVKIPSVGLGIWLINDKRLKNVVKMLSISDIDILIQFKLIKMKNLLV